MFSSQNSQVASTADNYIEDVFSTWLYTGNGSTQTITNGIDLSTYGGLVWCKDRNSGAMGHHLVDTARGASKDLQSQSTNGQVTTNTVTAFNSNGFALGTSTDVNTNGTLYTSWAFRKQAKFFDVVTWSGNSTAGRTIPHNLGSVPGCIIVKCTSTITDWAVYHRSLSSAANALQLNTTGAQITATTYWNSTAPTSSVFTVGADNDVNATGRTYVAYLFAHDAGGFGAAGTDNVISCGTFTTDGSENSTTNLGYEPQWLLLKATAGGTAGSQPWHIFDNMRGLTVSGKDDASLQPNNSNAESQVNRIGITSTGFTTNAFGASTTFIYIAIRRGPMRTPTSGTSVFTPATRTGTGTTGVVVTDATFPIDLVIGRGRAASNPTPIWIDRLRGATVQFRSDNTDAEAASTIMSSLASQTGWIGSTSGTGAWNTSSVNYIQWYFRRAPGFFDVVCYTGVGASATLNHNLGVVPEMVIVKGRSVISNWETYLSVLGGTAGNALAVNSTAAKSGTPPVSSATTTTFTLNNGVSTSNGQTYVAYLFATLAGVSKVGSYQGNGTSKTIDCGFTAGARFVMIKRTDSTGDWYVWDTARGIVSGNDPHLSLNTTAAEVTTNDTIDPDNSGFIVNQVAATNVNVNNATYIFLAIA